VAGIMLIMMEQLALSLLAEGSNDSWEVRSQAWGALVIGVVLGTLFAVAVYFLNEKGEYHNSQEIHVGTRYLS
jgi:hypothetical protein